MKEIIKQIKDFPGYYISDKGNVYSTKYSKDLKPLSPGLRAGYLFVQLCKDSKTFNKYVHRLVAEVFIPNLKNLPQVNHLDENKHNNSVKNLEWSSPEDNLRYSCCKPVMDITTGAIYPSATDASKALNIDRSTIGSCLAQRSGKYKGHKFIYLPRATEDSVNTIEFFSKKFEIPEIFDEEDFVKLFDID